MADLIVHGRDTETHDKNLHSVLQRLSEKQLTVSAEKCTFRNNRAVFMGLWLSKHGVGPAEENVRAVAEVDAGKARLSRRYVQTTFSSP